MEAAGIEPAQDFNQSVVVQLRRSTTGRRDLKPAAACDQCVPESFAIPLASESTCNRVIKIERPKQQEDEEPQD